MSVHICVHRLSHDSEMLAAIQKCRKRWCSTCSSHQKKTFFKMLYHRGIQGFYRMHTIENHWKHNEDDKLQAATNTA